MRTRPTMALPPAVRGALIAASVVCAVSACTPALPDAAQPAAPAPTQTTALPAPAASVTSGTAVLLRDDVTAPGLTAVTAGVKQTSNEPVVAWRAVLTARDLSATAKQVADAVLDANAGTGWALVARREGDGYQLTGQRRAPGSDESEGTEHLVVDVLSPAHGVPVMVRVLHATVTAA